jgi:hypothetical protein
MSTPTVPVRQSPPDSAQFLIDNPLYRRECFVAWKCGGETLRKFLEGDDATRLFIVRQLEFLDALFALPEFSAKEF